MIGGFGGAGAAECESEPNESEGRARSRLRCGGPFSGFPLVWPAWRLLAAAGWNLRSNRRKGTLGTGLGRRTWFGLAGPAGRGGGLEASGRPGRRTRSRSVNRWLRSPEPGTGEPADSPSTMAARWSRDSSSVVMMSESTASEPARILSSTASMPCVNRAIGSRPTIAAAPLMLWAARNVLSRCARSPRRRSRSISPSSRLIRSSRASSKNISRKRSSELPKAFTSQERPLPPLRIARSYLETLHEKKSTEVPTT